MDYRTLNPVRDFRDREEMQKEKISNKANKDFLYLILLLVIVGGVFLWQNPEFGQGYFEKINPVKFASQLFDRIKAMIGPKISLSEDSDLDLSEINIESLITQKEPAFTEVSAGEENGIGGPLIGELPGVEEALEQEVVVSEKKLTLEEIQQEINRIAKEVERIDKEVQILVALSKIQQEAKNE